MSMLNASASYRREERAASRVEQRVPVVMPLVDVQVDLDGTVAVRLDREPYATGTPLHREDLQRLLGKLATDLDTPIRVEVREADGSTFTDIVTPGSQEVRPPILPWQAPPHPTRRLAKTASWTVLLSRTSPWRSSSPPDREPGRRSRPSPPAR